MRVTGHAGTGKDAEMEEFESAFPDLSGEVNAEAVGSASGFMSPRADLPSQAPKPVFNALSNQPYGASPYPISSTVAAPQPRTSILPPPPLQNTLPAVEEDTEPIKAWRAKQGEEIKKRDEQDRQSRDVMKDKAEKWIDSFYEDYNKMKERNIRENKCVSRVELLGVSLIEPW